MNNILNGSDLAKAIISGSNALNNAKNKIDALNVFPVPDGDTGTNMSSTISSVVKNLETLQSPTVEEVSKSVAHDMIYEARGNSGVILSQIFKGFSLGCLEKEVLTTNELIIAFEEAAKRAYKSVFKPVEGTILTVIRETSENLRKELWDKELSILEFFENVVKFARKSCDETPNKLKTLREVGVTDSGGEGLFTILQGMLFALQGNFVEISNEADDIQSFISDKEVFNGEFGYCTEVLVDLKEPNNFNKDTFTKNMQKIANSLVIVQDDNFLKIHGHTLTPGKLLNHAQKYGEFIKIKSENMTLQANNSKANAQRLEEISKNSERREIAIISCNLGSGIIERMKELGCDYIVESGQTQNPSAQDLIEAIKAVNAKNVIILPNNSNIILVAQQAAQVFQDSNIIVVPTKTQMQGITAMLNFNHSTSVEDNLELITEAISEVNSGEVTKAVRNTTINNVKIKEGDYLSIFNGQIIASSKTLFEAGMILIEAMVDNNKEIVSIYYGQESSINDAEELNNFIESQFDIEVEIIDGKQPNYQFLIGVE
ncbi:DAK2 domain-containing protein [Mycoplasmopsis glycophila]|uniref:Dihydroxyacetone (Glycerone) kinase, DhaK2 subunit n=1 Tax=Mycoplasmopsis glycophila TaxID=171285 RepID=A0A449AWN5_9BACT|nr:DAK2 domain-containing protein [Mycoplasmopsis glycophila]VEU71150.1 dihydroxyacetone (glycerone) kinase, DhaK2 subunit [Mycoplasmopsis glycophila]